MSSIAELRLQRRFIEVKGKKPNGFTFSHSRSVCGGFLSPLDQQTGKRSEIDSETFVRGGGVCRDHQLHNGNIEAVHEVEGWKTYSELLAKGVGSDNISYCTGYADAPGIVIMDIDLKQESEKSSTLRTRLEEWLTSVDAPTGVSGKPANRKGAFLVSDPQRYGSKKHIWEHDGGVTVELYTPGARSHVKLYTLDGPLPTLEGVVLDDWLEGEGFKHTQPALLQVTDGRALAGVDGDQSFPGWQRRGGGENARAVLDSPTNLKLALVDTRLADCWRYDDWSKCQELLEDGVWRRVTDDDIIRVRERVGHIYGGTPLNFVPSERLVRDTVMVLAKITATTPRSRHSALSSGTGWTATRCLQGLSSAK